MTCNLLYWMILCKLIASGFSVYIFFFKFPDAVFNSQDYFFLKVSAFWRNYISNKSGQFITKVKNMFEIDVKHCIYKKNDLLLKLSN